MITEAEEPSELEQARKLLDTYPGEVDDFFKLWPPDKSYYFSPDKKAFLAYGVKNGVAICMGDPVGAKLSIGSLLTQFKQFCTERKWIIVFIQTTDKYRKSYAAQGFRELLIGADAFIDLDHFTKVTIRKKYFRNLANRFEKHHFAVTTHVPPHNEKLISELRKISDSWVKLPHRKEWAFLTGRFDSDYLQQVTLHVLRNQDGNAQAFTNELPPFKPGVASIDLMRRRFDAPTNSIDLLFIEVLRKKHAEGYTSFNLGMSPLDGKPYATTALAKLLLLLYRLSNRFIGFRGLHQFKAKYEPNWEPRYVWYQGPVLRLFKIGFAISKLMQDSD